MRGMGMAAAALVALSGMAGAQQVELSVDWIIDDGIKKALKLQDEAEGEWRERQNKHYLGDRGQPGKLNGKLGFWKFTAAAREKDTLRITLETVGTINPYLRASVMVQPPIVDIEQTVWSRDLLTSREWKDLIDSDASSPAILGDLTDRLNKELLGPKFRDNLKPLFLYAWVAEKAEELEQGCVVGLPLPWDRLKSSAQSVFRIDCGKPGPEVSVVADGLSRSYRDAMNRELLLAQPSKPIKGLTPKRVFVIDWRDFPSNPNIDIVRRCP